MSERADALALLERVFATDALAREYPLVFDPRFEGETLTIEEGGSARAVCTLLVREFHVAGQRLSGGLIGSVATEPAWRGRGLGTRLLARAEDALRERGCLFALLWADDPAFYLARGYAPFGREHDFVLGSELVARLPAPSRVRALHAGDAPFLARLHARHATRVERSEAQMVALLQVPGMRTLVREQAPLGEPIAYAALGRGRDLTDTIHDWAGEAEDVLALVSAHLLRRFRGSERGALALLAPADGAGDSAGLETRLASLGVVPQVGILGLGKVLDGALAAACLAAELRAPVEWDGTVARVRGPAAECALDLEGLQALLFGGPEVVGEAQALVQRLGFAPTRLPLAPFAFGLDSI